MEKTFTAEEFFNYIRSFSKVFIWVGEDGDNGIYIRLDPMHLKFFKRMSSFVISGELTQLGDEFDEIGGLVLTGNNYQCDIHEAGRRVEAIVKSNQAKTSIRFTLLKHK